MHRTITVLVLPGQQILVSNPQYKDFNISLYVQYGYAQQTTFITSFSFTTVCIKSSGGKLLIAFI